MTKKIMWDYLNSMRVFATQPPDIKQEIIDFMLNPETDLDYNYGWAAAEIVEHVGASTTLELAKKMFALKWPRENYISEVIVNAHKFEENKTIIQTLLADAKPAMYKRMLLTLDNLSVENEVVGLRALSQIKYPPKMILESRYCPTLDALKQMPSIMRLEALECLISVKLHGYNIFERITDREEFKNLLFGATLKYQARVQKVWDKYTELTAVGKLGTITIKASCPSCGAYEVKILNYVIHNADALGKTNFSRITRTWCAICGSHMESEPDVKFETEK